MTSKKLSRQATKCSILTLNFALHIEDIQKPRMKPQWTGKKVHDADNGSEVASERALFTRDSRERKRI